MFNPIRAIAASATLIAVGTLAFPGTALTLCENNLSANQLDYEQPQTFTPPVNDRLNSRLSEKTDSNESTAFFWYCIYNNCRS
ncbi:MAG: hypothetical protein Kow00121_58990 [Elainellaceae cyanobacterium]